MINLDFADVKTIMENQGVAHMGIGAASGENRAIEAVRKAIESPLLETTINGVTGVLLNISGDQLSLTEVYQAADLVQESASPDANIIFGAAEDANLNGEIKVTIVATGYLDEMKKTEKTQAEAVKQEPVPEPAPAVEAKPEPETQDQAVETAKETEAAGEPAKEAVEPKAQTGADKPAEPEEDTLDIPTFIRQNF
jgi:cell division protein FtsZ